MFLYKYNFRKKLLAICTSPKQLLVPNALNIFMLLQEKSNMLSCLFFLVKVDSWYDPTRNKINNKLHYHFICQLCFMICGRKWCWYICSTFQLSSFFLVFSTWPVQQYFADLTLTFDMIRHNVIVLFYGWCVTLQYGVKEQS